MSRELWKAVQRELKQLGLYVGSGTEIDGIPGPLTVQAVAAFQRSRKLDVRFPGTVGSKTLAALGISESVAAADPPSLPWVTMAQHRIGLQEERDFKKLSEFLAADGKTLGDPRALPWCGDFVQTVIALSLPQEPMVSQPYAARGWLRFGVGCTPCFGAVAVFWRGSKTGTKGHVGFLVGDDENFWYVLGGNQSNKVCIARMVKARLLETRWPKSHGNPEVPLPDGNGLNAALSTNEA